MVRCIVFALVLVRRCLAPWPPAFRSRGPLRQQAVEQQAKVEGRTDPGWSARAGVRFQIASVGPIARAASSESSYWRSYMFLEAQHMSAKVDGQNLGGNAFVVGFRMEFNFN